VLAELLAGLDAALEDAIGDHRERCAVVEMGEAQLVGRVRLRAEQCAADGQRGDAAAVAQQGGVDGRH
jgi:hypothetical protein